MRVNVAIAIRPIGLDDLSDVRHVHSLAYRSLTGPALAEDQVDAIVEFVRSPTYSDFLLSHGCIGAWIGNHLCGTAGWGPGSNVGVGAKLAAVCVDPLFSRLGIGRRLVEAAETRARRAGFSTMSSRTTANAVPFFESLGYGTSSQGAWMTPSGVSVPVVHMRKGPERDIQKAPLLDKVPLVSEQVELMARLH
jgi:GNAT superfamily N-acetyltransferase